MKAIQSFFLGIIAVLGALALEIIFLNFSEPIQFPAAEVSLKELFSFSYLFFAAIVLEEFAKTIVIYKALPRKENVTVNALFFGLGFSVLELASIYWSNRNGIAYDFPGLVGIVIIHISTSLIIGYSFIESVPVSFPKLLRVFVTATAVHSAYNIINIAGTSYQNQLIYFLFIFLVFLDIFLVSKSIRLKK